MDFGDFFGRIDADQIADLIDLVAKNKGSLEALGQLPEYLDKIASALGGAGEQAKSAAFALVGEDGKSGVRATLGGTAEALSEIATSLGKGIDRIADAAEGIGRVPLLDGPAAKLVSATAEMANTTDRLADLAEAMDVIGDTLAKVGAALAKLGDHLDESGGAAHGFAELGR